jgi:hypothetical protein
MLFESVRCGTMPGGNNTIARTTFVRRASCQWSGGCPDTMCSSCLEKEYLAETMVRCQSCVVSDDDGGGNKADATIHVPCR